MGVSNGQSYNKGASIKIDPNPTRRQGIVVSEGIFVVGHVLCSGVRMGCIYMIFRKTRNIGEKVSL